MRRASKPKSASIKYPRRVEARDTRILQRALQTVLRARASRPPTIAAVLGLRRSDVIRRYNFWRSWCRRRRDDRPATTRTHHQVLLSGEREVEGQGPQGTGDQRSDNLNHSGALAGSGDPLAGWREASARVVTEEMTSHNDSIIWNNRSSDQVSREVESNLSLVVNPPSSLSQTVDDSVVSEDSQYTRSSQLDLALEDERRWMKYRIDNLNRDECIINCVLAQMMLSSDELPGSRDVIPSDEDSKQTLLYLSYGGYWELNSLRAVLDLAEFLPVGLRRLCGLGVRDRGPASRKVLEGRLEQCLDLSRRLNLQQTG